MREKNYWLGLSVFNGIGPRRFKLLYDYFGSARKIWEASREKLLATGLPAKIVNDFSSFRQKFKPDFYSSWLAKKGIKFLTFRDKNYPKNLKQIEDAPFLLYFKGEIKKEDDLSLGVVGTRRPTLYGKEVTQNLVADLVGCGLTIVSGMARGIDSVAHRTAIEVGGRTIAVFACGIDVIYPPENRQLSEEIIKHGAVISEFPPGTKPSLGSFPYRNRIISGLSLGVLVTEGATRSGSLITARRAADQGREVFAVPGPITSRMSGATAKLLKDGAKIVRDVADILEELDIKVERQKVKGKKGEETSEEKVLLELLQNGALHVDDLVRQSGLPTAKVCSIMTLMEIQGKVRNLGGMTYALSHR